MNILEYIINYYLYFYNDRDIKIIFSKFLEKKQTKFCYKEIININ